MKVVTEAFRHQQQIHLLILHHNFLLRKQFHYVFLILAVSFRLIFRMSQMLQPGKFMNNTKIRIRKKVFLQIITCWRWTLITSNFGTFIIQILFLDINASFTYGMWSHCWKPIKTWFCWFRYSIMFRFQEIKFTTTSIISLSEILIPFAQKKSFLVQLKFSPIAKIQLPEYSRERISNRLVDYQWWCWLAITHMWWWNPFCWGGIWIRWFIGNIMQRLWENYWSTFWQTNTKSRSIQQTD